MRFGRPFLLIDAALVSVKNAIRILKVTALVDLDCGRPLNAPAATAVPGPRFAVQGFAARLDKADKAFFVRFLQNNTVILARECIAAHELGGIERILYIHVVAEAVLDGHLPANTLFCPEVVSLYRLTGEVGDIPVLFVFGNVVGLVLVEIEFGGIMVLFGPVPSPMKIVSIPLVNLNGAAADCGSEA